MDPVLRRWAVFVLVGTAAAAVHYVVVVALVELARLPPLAANVAGWAMAFGVSFGGHARFTFAAQRAPLARAGRRFLLLSAAGFALNQAAYALLLTQSALPYDLALVLVLLGVAVATYLLGRHWAFLGAGSDPQ